MVGLGPGSTGGRTHRAAIPNPDPGEPPTPGRLGCPRRQRRRSDRQLHDSLLERQRLHLDGVGCPHRPAKPASNNHGFRKRHDLPSAGESQQSPRRRAVVTLGRGPAETSPAAPPVDPATTVRIDMADHRCNYCQFYCQRLQDRYRESFERSLVLAKTEIFTESGREALALVPTLINRWPAGWRCR